MDASIERDEDWTEDPQVFTVVMPDGAVRNSRPYYLSQMAAPEYVVAAQSAVTGQWIVRGWFSSDETASRVEASLLTYTDAARVAFLAVEGDIK